MGNYKIFFCIQFNYVRMVFFLTIIFLPSAIFAQQSLSVTGKVIEEKSQQTISFATVALYKIMGDAMQLITGTMTNEAGIFTVNPVESGNYKLRISSVGYKTAIKNIELTDAGIYDAGIIQLQDSTQLIAETVVEAERVKGKAENEKTIFYMNKKILSATGNTPDLLRYIPGIQVDLKQNISLEGKADILLFVNGKERDKSYISQLNPSLIDRVEIMNTPPSNYDGNASGVINIILKKEQETGFNGQIFTEIPTSGSIVYSFPTYSIQYGLKKVTLFTSYNGEINFENIDEIYNRQIRENGPVININSVEQVRQKNLSHKFHYGFDYYATPRDIINYYGSVNPYSYEQDGNVIINITGNENINRNFQRDETDKNLNVFNSIYYKHLFKKEGREIAIDISNSSLRTNSSIAYLNNEGNGSASVFNTEKPEQGSTSLKIDYTTPIDEKTTLNTGIKTGVKSMNNKTVTDFGYHEQLHAVYGTLHYKKANYNLNVGFRTEYTKTELKTGPGNTELSLLPYASFQYKLNVKHSLSFSFRRSVNRPSVFLLNPYQYIDNIYAVRKGNPMLKPEFRYHIYAEHAIRLNVSYISYRLYYENISNAINNLTLLNDSAAFETQAQNLGNIHRFGLQFLGSLKFGPLTVGPSVRLYHQSTSGNSLAKQYEIKNRGNLVFDAGFSSILSLKHNYTISCSFQYSTVKYNIQDNALCDALYLLSMDKTFKKDLQVGVVAALPFAKTFVYQGSEIEARNFSIGYRGNLKLPVFPIMFRVKYQFHSGKNKTMVNRDKEEVPMRPKSGF